MKLPVRICFKKIQCNIFYQLFFSTSIRMSSEFLSFKSIHILYQPISSKTIKYKYIKPTNMEIILHIYFILLVIDTSNPMSYEIKKKNY